jgi:hypothetical protein
MKKISFFAPKYTLVLLLFALAGCHKIDWDDVWHKHDPNCQVKELTYMREFDSGGINAVFSYNHQGQPTKVVFDYVSTARPNLIFKYDHKGRLTDYIMPYANENYEIWFSYKHDYKGRIVSDSQYVFGSYIDSVPSPNSVIKTAGFYEYDPWGRISKITRHHQLTIVTVDEYVYNADGNLSAINHTMNGSPSGVQTFTNYDDEVSILRTNKIWAFVSANYSKNNQVAAISYNSKGLPTQFNAPGFNTYLFLHETYLGKSTIEYRCK